MDTSQRLALPFILPGQSQKELFHNEALQMLDTIVAAAVEEPPRNDPPASPVPGSCFIIGPSPTGAWADQPSRLAAYSQAGWRFIDPPEGLQAWIKSASVWAAFGPGGWDIGTVRGERLLVGGEQVVGARAPAVADVSGGATVDTQARGAIAAMLAAMRGHGLIATE